MDSSVIVLDSSEDEECIRKDHPSQLQRRATNINKSKNNTSIITIDDSFTINSNDILNKSKLGGNISSITIDENINLNDKIISGELSFVPIKSPPAQDLKRRLSNGSSVAQNHSKNRKRIKPTLVSSQVSIRQLKNEDADDDGFLDQDKSNEMISETESGIEEDKDTNEPPERVTPINEPMTRLLESCRRADPSSDMELLLNKKLIRYYNAVHPDYVNSKSFSKTVIALAEDIDANPGLVYLKMSSIFEELKIRKKSGQTVVANEEIASTGDARKDFQIKRLNHALYVLKKKIALLDEADVDLDDDNNSTFLLVERYKKRACEIYEKICDITGESKNAQRLVRKPITFKGTVYSEFNKTLQTFVNRTQTFPDLFDVLRCLEHCNKQYDLKLGKEEIKRIAQDAFIKIGRTLQDRRKTDLYETVSYFTNTDTDPALEDSNLQTKLIENQKYHKRINEIIDKYAEQQDKTIGELKKIVTPETLSSATIATATTTTASVSTPITIPVEKIDKKENNKENHITNGNEEIVIKHNSIESIIAIDDDDDEEEDDEDEEADEDDDEIDESAVKFPENLEDIVISDDEELVLS